MEYFNIYNSRYLQILKNEIIEPIFMIEKVDWTEQNVLENITDFVQDGSGSISISYQQGVRRSIQFTLFNGDGRFSPSPLTGNMYIGTKFKLYSGLKDGEDSYWWNQGVFIIKNAKNSSQSGLKTVDIEAVDKFGLFGNELGYSQLTGEYKIEKDTKIYDVIKDFLRMDMQNGYIVDYVQPLFDDEYIDEVMPYTLTKDKGDYFGDIMIELANIIGCNIYYDRHGILNITSGTTDLTYSQYGISYQFDSNEMNVLDPSMNYNYIDVVNSVTVIGTNINDKIYSYKAQNTNPLSSTRIEYIGLKESSPIESAMVYDDDRAKEFAIYKLNQLSILQSLFDFSCSIIPHLEVDEVITVTDDYFNYSDERFIVQSMTIPIGAKDKMNISCSNIAELPYYTEE